MKKLILLSAIVMITSCNKKDCDEDKEALTKKYEQALQSAGSNPDAIQELTREYNEKWITWIVTKNKSR